MVLLARRRAAAGVSGVIAAGLDAPVLLARRRARTAFEPTAREAAAARRTSSTPAPKPVAIMETQP
jgi:hypothetical protein